jgi:hypothetical protein
MPHRLPKLLSAALLAGVFAQVSAQKPQPKNEPPSSATSETTAETKQSDPVQVRIKLANGGRLQVDDAWESPQGIWYRQGGMTYLLTRDRASGIERATVEPPNVEPQVAKVTEATPTPASADGPAWIYLVGGARVEAESATESAGGVWYRRGSLSIFIDRSRVERIEREDPEKVAKAGAGHKDLGWSTGSRKLDGLIRQNGSRYGVDPYLIFLVMEQESHFNPRVVSPKGAQGLMQLMPGTGARFGVRRPFDPAQNISGGTRFLRQLLDRFKGRVDLVLASYNAGEGAVIKYGHKVPPYRETRNYVRNISKRYTRSTKSPGKTTPRASSATASGGK